MIKGSGMSLANKTLIQCNQSSTQLTGDEINKLLDDLHDWNLTLENGVNKIIRCFKFKNYASAQAYANKVADLADQENHHPRVCIEWGKVTISWWTHSIEGLFSNDFIMAARCDELFAALKD